MREQFHRALRNAVFGTILLPVACSSGDGGSPTGPSNDVASIEVTLPASVEALKTVTGSATARNSSGTNVQATFTWTSSNTSVATVTNGVVRGISPGTATITARSGSIEGTRSIQVATQNVNALVSDVRTTSGLPAMGGALVTRDGIVALGVAGNRRITGGSAVTAADRWHIGSNLKAITALLAAIAVDRNAISWTTTVAQAFPELAASIRAEYQTVTLEDLLSNRAGIRNDPPAAVYSGTTARAQRESLAAWALGATPAVAKGTYHYSNPGFVIAGAMVDRALNGTYEDLVTSLIATPLGVGGIGWGPTTVAGGNDQPVGHSRSGSTWLPCEACDNPPGLSAAGRAHMPLATWARIIQEFLRA